MYTIVNCSYITVKTYAAISLTRHDTGFVKLRVLLNVLVNKIRLLLRIAVINSCTNKLLNTIVSYDNKYPNLTFSVFLLR